MGRIQLLGDQLINKIAAGEVVERPASVVKELVENSLDAGATRITLDLQDGGKKRIVISDNGFGMDPEDAVLALTRHATSKIRSDEDLFQLSTMGFRGEALASIASVAKLTLMTCELGKTEGTRVRTEGGSELDVSGWQSTHGTTIVVEDLFFNVPARAKFLKTSATEYGSILELVQSLALAWPQVDFTLIHNGKEQLRAPVVHTSQVERTSLPDADVLRQRFTQIFKQDAELAMIYVSGENAYGQMRGLVSAPGVERGTARDIFLFINGRFVKDKLLRFAVLRGYHSHLLKGKYPVAAVFLNVDPGLLDVNVHPSKTEVRLQFGSELQGMIAMAIRDGLRKADWSGIQAEDTRERSSTRDVLGRSYSHSESADEYFHVSDQTPSTPSALASKAKNFETNAASHTPVTSSASVFMNPARAYTYPLQGPGFGSTGRTSSLPIGMDADQETIPWTDLTYLGSIADCYLIFGHGTRRDGSRMLVIDQHAFHERILYERLSADKSLLSRSQGLLVPEAFAFTAEEIEALKDVLPLLEQNGFKVNILQGESGSEIVELHAVPAILAKADAEQLLRAFIDHTNSETPLTNNVGLAHDLLSTMACHAAVRAGEALGQNELQALLNEASSVDFFHNCPHGRRVFRWWTEAQIGRWFDR